MKWDIKSLRIYPRIARKYFLKIYSVIQHLLKLADLQSIKEQRLNNWVNFQLSIMKKLWDIAQENLVYIKFLYSEKSTKFWEISTLLLSYVVPVKSKVETSINFLALSEYMNFNFQLQTPEVSQFYMMWRSPMIFLIVLMDTMMFKLNN